MNAKYEYALRCISKQEQALSAHSMADYLLKNNITNFWKEVKTLNRSKTAIPCNIEGVTVAEDIADLWRQRYAALFNYIKSEPYHVGKIEEENIYFHTNGVLNAIGQKKLVAWTTLQQRT